MRREHQSDFLFRHHIYQKIEHSVDKRKLNLFVFEKSAMTTQVSEFTREALTRKSTINKSSTAVFWGSFNLITLAIVLSDLHVGGWCTYSIFAWWGEILTCSVCVANILVHLKQYVAPSFSAVPLEVNDTQKKLMAINEGDPGFKNAVPKKKDSTPAPNKKLSFSALMESTLRTRQGPIPQTPTVSSTPINLSAGSWAPTPAASWSPSPAGSWSPPPSSTWSPVPIGITDNSAYGNTNFGMTPVNNSAGSWAPTPMHNGTNVWSTTPINQSAGSWAPTPSIRLNESWGSCSPISPLNFSMGSSVNESYLSNSSLGSIQTTSWNYHQNNSSIMDSSFGFLSGSAQSMNASNSGTNPNPSSPPNMIFHTPSKIFKIATREDLDKYLRDYQEQEKKKLSLSQNEMNSSVNGSLWLCGSTSPQQGDLLNMLRKNVYQVATKDVGEENLSSNNKNEDVKTSSSSSSSVNIIWTKRNVTPLQLFQYEENLRIWISSNILVPLVKAIEKTNEALISVAPDLQIGTVGVDKLKKAAQNISGVKQLSNLLAFLDITLHQDYLVHRLKQLAQGGAISAFKWNGGSKFNGKQWWDEYPSDTYILLHLFSMYMDTQLPPDPMHPEGRVFSSNHVVKTPEKPPKPANRCMLYLTQVSPPHLKVIIEDEECEVGNGHKNFMHSLLLFCHHVAHKQHSQIAGVNLNLTGINLAWVVDAL